MNDATRTMRRRTYLMCRPLHFDVTYSINPWMDPGRPTSPDVGLTQWKWLHDQLVDLGHRVVLIEPEPGLPDMVFAANGAITVDGRALVARFRHDCRTGESRAYLEWFRRNGWAEVAQARHVNEGEGDFLLVGDQFLAGSGFRTEPRAHEEVATFFGRDVVGLTLIDPRFYHLDTALAVLDDDEVMYYPPAFSPESRERLAADFPDAVLVGEAEAEAFGVNAVSDGVHVLLPEHGGRLAGQLAERGYVPIGVDMSELLKAGGAVKCCANELRGGPDD
ncbi:dimethylargininase [Kutzneria buriramensis]|uniref:N-dimethylarginine dimethylaminohydrolase n=1 Tax=Kutzneria buriramensis TaxID=1045776 RepID=A0A3E0HKE8_9PSEU|nr:dimethylargininase [Kutzneria buriramensis]REH46921.1 N-dimethylarginine dimethylaminohydrolase [Kutzneria buriramensis]